MNEIIIYKNEILRKIIHLTALLIPLIYHFFLDKSEFIDANFITTSPEVLSFLPTNVKNYFIPNPSDLSFETLNEDYVSELAQKTLGMIKEDNVLVILDE